MTKHMFRALIIAAMVGAAGSPAFAQVKSVFGLGGGQLTIDTPTGDTDIDLYGFTAAASAPVGQNMVVQGDLSLGGFENGASRSDGMTATAHLGWQNSDYAVGAYVGLDDASVNGGPTGTIFGGEYLMFMPQYTVSVGGGFGTYDTAAANDLTKSGLEIEGRYFVNDNLRLDLRGSYSKLNPAGADSSGFGGGAGIEWKPNGSPISLFASYDAFNIDSGVAASTFDGEVLSIGIKLDLGNKTLKARDRSGPVFKPSAGFGATSWLF